MKVTVDGWYDSTIHAPANTFSMITLCARDADYLVPRQPQPLPTCQKTKPRLALRIPILTNIRIRNPYQGLLYRSYSILDIIWSLSTTCVRSLDSSRPLHILWSTKGPHTLPPRDFSDMVKHHFRPLRLWTDSAVHFIPPLKLNPVQHVLRA